MYKCTSVTVTVYICMVIIALTFNILEFFGILGLWERGVVSKEIIKKNLKINILLNKCVE